MFKNETLFHETLSLWLGLFRKCFSFALFSEWKHHSLEALPCYLCSYQGCYFKKKAEESYIYSQKWETTLFLFRLAHTHMQWTHAGAVIERAFRGSIPCSGKMSTTYIKHIYYVFLLGFLDTPSKFMILSFLSCIFYSRAQRLWPWISIRISMTVLHI